MLKNIPLKYFVIGVSVVATLNGIAWSAALNDSEEDALYFLNVGQGDSELIAAGRARFLIDGGKDDAVLKGLDKIIPAYRKRIDALFVSHGQQDHLGGLFGVLDRYDVGMVIYNGESVPLWNEFEKKLKERRIPFLSVAQGDSVSYGTRRIKVLWPSVLKKETNENSMVLQLFDSDLSAVFSADISSKVEKILLPIIAKADVLKVSHHGSKYSSSAEFVSALNPEIAVVEVGENSYGHPTPETLGRITEAGAAIFRTDRDGTIRITRNGGALEVAGVR